MIQVGVIGYGYWGPNLVRNFSELTDVRIKWVADQSEERRALVQRRYPGVKTTAEANDIINDPSIDAVVIATPVSTHFELASRALEAGKHVWVEKPMTQTHEQSLRLRDIAARKNAVLFADHTFIYTGAVQQIGRIMRDGQLGKAYYYDSTRVNLGLFQRDVNVIADLAVHDFSILDYLLNEHPCAVSASGTNHFPGTPENLAYVTLFYESGTIAHTNVSWLAPVKVRRTLIGGSKQMIDYDDLEPSEKVKVYDKGISFTEDAEQIYAMRVGYRAGDMWAPKLSGTEALGAASQHFVDCINKQSEPITGGQMGSRIVQLVEAATESMQSRGKTVNLTSGE